MTKLNLHLSLIAILNIFKPAVYAGHILDYDIKIDSEGHHWNSPGSQYRELVNFINASPGDYLIAHPPRRITKRVVERGNDSEHSKFWSYKKPNLVIVDNGPVDREPPRFGKLDNAVFEYELKTDRNNEKLEFLNERVQESRQNNEEQEFGPPGDNAPTHFAVGPPNYREPDGDVFKYQNTLKSNRDNEEQEFGPPGDDAPVHFAVGPPDHHEPDGDVFEYQDTLKSDRDNQQQVFGSADYEPGRFVPGPTWDVVVFGFPNRKSHKRESDVDIIGPGGHDSGHNTKGPYNPRNPSGGILIKPKY